MSEDDNPKYKDGDIVWVKIGGCWWPGEITEQGPEDFTSKKPPLAIVKFFNESTYEFVKSYNNIYQYNCERKNEFIKKGMDSFRGNNAHMEKFPGDVSLAEIKTEGNPNILSDPIFAPQKKLKLSEILGTPSPKKTPKNVKPRSQKKKPTKFNITHRRFLGCDDYEAHIRVQYPGKDCEQNSDEEEIVKLNAEPTSDINCSICAFTTTRLEVMLFHVRCHIDGIPSPVPAKRKKNTSPKKKQKRSTAASLIKHITSEDDRANLNTLMDTDTDEDVTPKAKRKKTSALPKIVLASHKIEDKVVEEVRSKEKSVTDIRQNLLAEWSDSDEDAQDDLDTTGDKEDDLSFKNSKNEIDDLPEQEEEEDVDGENKSGKNNTIERMDTDEKLTEENLKEDTVESTDLLELPTTSEESTEDTTSLEEVSQAPLTFEKPTEPAASFEKLLEMEELPEVIEPIEKPVEAVPPLEELPQTSASIKTTPARASKDCFDFDEDLEEEESSIIHTAIGRKIPRVIPPPSIEKRKSLEETIEPSLPIAEDDENRMEVLKTNENRDDGGFREVMESTIMPEIPELLAKPLQSPKSEVATKLTNPKKRFVKSFEDFELLQNEQRKKEEEEELRKNAILETVLKQQESNKSEDFLSTVEISKLKTKIMSKLNEDEEQESHISSKIHKTPRSKILESYRNDIINEEKEEANRIEEEITRQKLSSPLPSPSKNIVSAFPDDDMELSPPRVESLPLNMVLTPTQSEEMPSSHAENQNEKTAEFETVDSPRNEPLELSLPLQKTDSFFDMSPPTAPKTDLTETSEIKSADEEKSQNNRIDEYFNDFLFDLDKKSESTEEEESLSLRTEQSQEEKTEEIMTDLNEVHVKCDDDAIDLAIQTNLTNFTNNQDEMSALTTLAMVSELESTEKITEEDTMVSELETTEKTIEEETMGSELETTEKIIQEETSVSELDNTNKISEEVLVSEFENTDKRTEEDMMIEDSSIKTPFLDKPEPELVQIDGNLTVVSEKELADAQVEITAEVAPYKKPVTLTSFSMDFSESNDEIKKPKEEPKALVPLPPLPEPFDIEEQIPSHEIGDKTKSRGSKLLERLTTADTMKKVSPKTKILIQSGKSIIQKTISKPMIISEKIIKPVHASSTAAAISIQKLSSKRNFQDADEIIDTFVIQKSKPIDEQIKLDEESLEYKPQPPKKSRVPTRKRVSHISSVISSSPTIAPTNIKTSIVSSVPGLAATSSGKAKILQQTIITPEGEILQPSVNKPTVGDDNDFDINSMPIVLSDQILTPESIENMPILLGDAIPENKNTEPKLATIKNPTIVRKAITPQMKIINKSFTEKTTPKVFKTTPKLVGSHSITPKFVRQNSFASGNSKHGKFVIVTTPSPIAQTSKYTVGKKPIIKRASEVVSTLAKVPNMNEPSGNKIMVLTTPQGQQQRVLLTPAQQKMMGVSSTKVPKTIVKSQLLTKPKDNISLPGSSGFITKSRLAPSHIISPLQGRNVRIERSVTPSGSRKIHMQPQKVQIKSQVPPQKTILIKNQHGQTVRKIQGTDDALLDQQVAQQLEAIKASGALAPKQDFHNFKTSKTIRKSHTKRPVQPQQKILKNVESTVTVPPLAPISPKKLEIVSSSEQKDKTAEGKDRQPTQLVIEDAQGHQTPINEGQILALPSETIDGQPQSYVLVTVDEAGNLTPLNNEAILSLDQNLNLGGGLTNAVLQIDQNVSKEGIVETSNEVPVEKEENVVLPSPPPPPPPEPIKELEPPPPPSAEAPGQQLIVTGDPIAAQKFLESLTEGNTDLANILANAEGSILIHADGQQILINTDSDNQMLLSVNTDSLGMSETGEGGGNPIFATQPPHKNQDILAAALADTDVFQQEQNAGSKLQSQLSPSGSLYPMNVPNVLETSLTLNSPIMTPLEVPSTNTKKISDESDILGQVPKNVDLPITITDPNITQTVSQQQIVNELHNNLELSLPISESITIASTEMNSPSFVYSLPSLDGGVDINQKPFNSSMPILTEEETIDTENNIKSVEDEKEEGTGFLDESDGLCALGGEMCSSLSEPPPDMFDLSAVLSSHHQVKASKDVDNDLKIDDKILTESASEESTNQTLIDEDSCEIPVQPPIVTTLSEVEGTAVKEVENGEGNV